VSDNQGLLAESCQSLFNSSHLYYFCCSYKIVINFVQNQIAELKAAQAPGAAALRSALLDPAVNLLLQRLRQELLATRARLEETQNELSAWKFTPDR
jgi:hypothetical protein